MIFIKLISFCGNIEHFISFTPHRNTILAIFCRLICLLSPRHASITQLLYYHKIIDGKEYFYEVSSIFEAVQGFFSSNLCPSLFCHILPPVRVSSRLSAQYIRHFLPLSVFQPQNQEQLYCGILFIDKLKTLVPHERKERTKHFVI